MPTSIERPRTSSPSRITRSRVGRLASGTARARLGLGLAALLASTPAWASSASPTVSSTTSPTVIRPTPAFLASPGSARVAASVASPEAAHDTAKSYAHREPSARQAEAFHGGSVGIYIGGSTLVVALVIVLLIVLL